MTDNTAPPALVDAVAALHRAGMPEPDVSDQVARNVDLTWCFGGTGTAVAVGDHAYLRTSFPARLNGWAIISDLSGSVTFTITACLFSALPTLVNIVASAPPAMITATQASGSIPEVATWTDVVPRDTVFDATVATISGGITAMTLSLRAKRLDL